ncbi:MAG: hypothetical protein NT069_25555 [Planctomycetota bacterium]|nr:hypothetical protein [Planctomycetota bacterium]
MSFLKTAWKNRISLRGIGWCVLLLLAARVAVLLVVYETGWETVSRQVFEASYGKIGSDPNWLLTTDDEQRARFWDAQIGPQSSNASDSAAEVLDRAWFLERQIQSIQWFQSRVLPYEVFHQEVEDRFIDQLVALRHDLAERATRLAPTDPSTWRARALLTRSPTDRIEPAQAISDYLSRLDECRRHDPDNALYDYLEADLHWNHAVDDPLGDSPQVLDPNRLEDSDAALRRGVARPSLAGETPNTQAIALKIHQLPLSRTDRLNVRLFGGAGDRFSALVKMTYWILERQRDRYESQQQLERAIDAIRDVSRLRHQICIGASTNLDVVRRIIRAEERAAVALYDLKRGNDDLLADRGLELLYAEFREKWLSSLAILRFVPDGLVQRNSWRGFQYFDELRIANLLALGAALLFCGVILSSIGYWRGDAQALSTSCSGWLAFPVLFCVWGLATYILTGSKNEDRGVPLGVVGLPPGLLAFYCIATYLVRRIWCAGPASRRFRFSLLAASFAATIVATVLFFYFTVDREFIWAESVNGFTERLELSMPSRDAEKWIFSLARNPYILEEFQRCGTESEIQQIVLPLTFVASALIVAALPLLEISLRNGETVGQLIWRLYWYQAARPNPEAALRRGAWWRRAVVGIGRAERALGLFAIGLYLALLPISLEAREYAWQTYYVKPTTHVEANPIDYCRAVEESLADPEIRRELLERERGDDQQH